MNKKKLKEVTKAIEYFETTYYIDSKVEASVEVKNLELVDDVYVYDAIVHYETEGESETYTGLSIDVKEVEKMIK